MPCTVRVVSSASRCSGGGIQLGVDLIGELFDVVHDLNGFCDIPRLAAGLGGAADACRLSRRSCIKARCCFINTESGMAMVHGGVLFATTHALPLAEVQRKERASVLVQ